jgi:hypothetical protein
MSNKFIFISFVTACLLCSFIGNLLYYTSSINNNKRIREQVITDRSRKLSIDRLLRNDARLNLQNRQPQQQQKYSSFHCIGARNETHTHDRALCHFKNLCYNQSDKQFFYYERDGPFRQPKYFADGPVYDAFPNIYPTMGSKFKIKVMRGNIPEDMKFGYSKLTVFSQAQNVDNFGHIIADNMFPIYHALNELQLWNPDELRVIWYDFNERCQNMKGMGRDKIRDDCMRQAIKTMINTGFTKYKPWDFSDMKNETVCFKNVVLGVGQYSYSSYLDALHSQGQGESWRKFRDFMRWKIAGIEPDTQQQQGPRPHQVLIVKREGMRRIVNHDIVVAGLRKQYPGLKIIESSMGSISLAQQVQLIANSTVIITPSGGISFATLFASEDTSVISFNFWIPSARKSSGMDQAFFQRIPYLRMFQYPINSHKEIRLELDKRVYRWADYSKGYKYRIDRKFRLGGSVIVDVNRLSPLLYWAMASLEDIGAAIPYINSK